MLSLQNVSKVFKTGTFGGAAVTAVSDVSFDIRPGEIVALIGESGSGKTTVGRMILRLTTVDRTARSRSAGRTSRRSADVSSTATTAACRVSSRTRSARTTRCSRSTASSRWFAAPTFPGLTRAEWSTRRQRALEDVGLEPADVLGKFPHQLSGGQLQRLLISRALILDIEILVADEIISMLDASTRIDVLNILGDLKERGLGVLFVTHDLALGNYLSDRVVILQRGRVVEMGPTPKVFTNPVHPYTRMLLACVPQLTSKWE